MLTPGGRSVELRRISMAFALCAGASLGCREECESDVTGGEKGDRESIELAEGTFLSLLDSSLQVCVPKVKVVASIGDTDLDGWYSGTWRRIRLATTRPNTVYHELCHAVREQNDIALDEPKWGYAEG